MRTILLAFVLLISILASAQITTPVVRANFGVDADLRANYLTGTGVTGAADDWFWDGTAGTGRNVIDTTGAAKIVLATIPTCLRGPGGWHHFSAV